MKKFIFMIMLMFLAQNAWSAQSWTSTSTGPYRNSKIQMVKGTIDNTWPYTNMDDLTLTTGHVHGKILRIVCDSTGTDTSWGLILKDSLGIALFTKANCSSDSEPFSYAVSEYNTDSNSICNIPVSGALSIDVDDVAQTDEIQTCTADVDADANSYTITINGETTTALAFDASTATILTALEVLDCIGASGMTSVVSTLDAGNSTPIVLTFADALGNVPMASFDVTDTNAVDVTVVETTEGGNAFSNLDVYIFYEQ